MHTHTHPPSFLACSAWVLLPSTSMATKECSWHFRSSERSGQLVVGPSTSYNMLDCYDFVPFHWEWRMGASSPPPPPIVFSRLHRDNLVEHQKYTKKIKCSSWITIARYVFLLKWLVYRKYINCGEKFPEQTHLFRSFFQFFFSKTCENLSRQNHNSKPLL